jgi:hypothetical protein
MGVTIQFESHRVELPAIFELEYDNSDVGAEPESLLAPGTRMDVSA